MSGTRWTPEEEAKLRKLYGTMTVAEVAERLGCSRQRVASKAIYERLTKPIRPWLPEHTDALRELHAQGWSDQDVADKIGHTRDRVSKRRRALKLPSQRKKVSARTRAKNAASTAQTVKKHGIKSAGQIRQIGWGRRARALGWPADLRPRELQIVHALYHRGPMTRRELTEAIGLPWRGSAKSLKSHGGGSYTADLMRAGRLVAHRSRDAGPSGKGWVYSLPLDFHPTAPDTTLP